MQTTNKSESTELKAVQVANWAGVIMLLCKHGYSFAGDLENTPAPVNFFQRLWEFILNSFGKKSHRQMMASIALVNQRDRLKQQLVETHIVVGDLVASAQQGLAKSNSWKVNIDYEGSGTVFFKTDIEITRTRSDPERFSVLIDPPRVRL